MPGGYNLGTASGRIVVDGSGAKKGFAVAQAAADTFINSVNKKAADVTKLGTRLTAASAAGVAGFGLAINVASKFENRLSAIQAVSGATKDEMDRISASALQIGAATSFGATDAAQAFEELIKAGISVDDALNGAAAATVSMAEAGEIALPRAAEIAAAAMNNFNLSAEDMPKIADMVAGAANASAIGVEEFAQSMNQAGAVSSLVGLSFEDMAVAIAEMGNAGIKGSDAGTSLKTMLMNLQPQTKKQINLSKELGLLTLDVSKGYNTLKEKGLKPVDKTYAGLYKAAEKYVMKTEGLKAGTKGLQKATEEYLMKNGAMQNAFFTSEGKLKSLSEVQDVLQTSLKGMSQQQKIAALETLFGADAIRAAAIMADNGAEGYEKLSKSMNGVAAADVAATRMDNLSGAVEEFKGSVETIAIRVGQLFIPALTKVIQTATVVLNWISQLSDSVYKWATGLGVAATAASGLVGGLILIVSHLGPMLAILIALRRGYAVFSLIRAAATAAAAGPTLLAGALIFLRTVAGGAASALIPFYSTLMRLPLIASLAARGLMILRVSMSLLMKAIPIIGILLTLAAVGKYLYDNFKPFHDLVDKVAAILSDVLASAIKTAQDAFRGFMQGFVNGTGTMTGFVGVANTLGKGIRAMIGAFVSGEAGASGFMGVMQQIGIVFRNIWTAVQQLGAVLAGTFLGIWNQLVGVFQTSLLPALQNLANVFATQIWPAVQQLANVVISTLIPALLQIWGALQPLFSSLLQLAGVIGGILLGVLGGLASFIFGTVLPAILSLAGPVLKVLLESIANVAVFIVNYLLVPLINFVAFLSGFLVPILNVVGVIFKVVFGIVLAVVMSVINNVIGVVQGLIQFFQGMIQIVKGIFTGQWGMVWEGVKNIFFGAVKFLWNLAQLWIVGKLVKVVGLGLKLVSKIFSSVWGGIKGFLSRILSAIWGVVKSVFSRISGTVRSVMNGMKNIISSVWNFIKSIFVRQVNFVKSVISNGFRAAVNLGSKIFGGLKSRLVSTWNNVMSFFRGIPGKVKGAFSGAGRWLWNAGKNILSGLKDGIMSAWNTVKNTLSNLTSKIPDWKGPAPVDKKLLTPAGEMIMDSLRRGLESGISEVYGLLQGVTGDIPMNVIGNVSTAGSLPALLQAQISGMAISPTQLLKQNTPDPETLRPINVTVEAVDTNNADEVAGKIVTSIKRFQRGAGAYAESRS